MSSIKFFYSPGSCALASHIALEESGLGFDPALIALAKGEQKTPEYLKINPKGRVPAIQDGDFTLTENPAILRYVARKAPAAKLWPDDPIEEARCTEWLAFISSTVHITYAHIRRPERYASDPKSLEDVIATGRETARDVWAMIEKKIAAHPWAAGETYSVADAYAFVFWTWGRGPVLQYDMAKDYPAYTAHARKMWERPAVKRAMERESLKPVA
ncbi:glutathione S-transferase GST-6.0 [Variibacter gotjawalensis]|uniref:Glutathione S-transferase GST-6.0 n=1 Tax=Variibacter gotjawalensis TaxID=1333996 RepID=A0A0S3PQQ3_9BRAD|nr:glutathione S-transferase family protein [Variibacter gotjawalensis]NIK48511.1 glutathione S-transferase [Variibacter gotjawalensis]RZS50376.1 glutathione S-transferase [Variibacter gotjawalensis]BAT58211.1 glutathione S-transferase GST-6.0 [Variibacter gotjawalensis]